MTESPLYVVFLITFVVVAIMASIFVFSQIRQLWHAATVGIRSKNYTMLFWSIVAIMILIAAMSLFIVAMLDIVDGRFDSMFGQR